MENKVNDKEIPSNNRWIEVRRDLEVKIIVGDLNGGDKIPTLAELTEQYKIGRATAQKVIKNLSDDGIIVCKTAIGCFVKPFVRDKLYKKHLALFQDYVLQAINLAVKLHLDEELVKKLAISLWNEHKLKNNDLSSEESV